MVTSVFTLFFCFELYMPTSNLIWMEKLILDDANKILKSKVVDRGFWTQKIIKKKPFKNPMRYGKSHYSFNLRI